MRVICIFWRKNSNQTMVEDLCFLKKGESINVITIVIPWSVPAPPLMASLGNTESGLEHRQALCYWILIVRATPATVAETNLWLSEYNARVTQISPITLTIRPFAQNRFSFPPTTDNNLKNWRTNRRPDINENDAVVAMAFKQGVFPLKLLRREIHILVKTLFISRGWK